MSKDPTKSITDFPEFVEASEKLTDFETRLNVARIDLQSARDNASEHAGQREENAVRALLSGETVVTESDVSEMARTVRVLERATEAQRREVQEIAQRIERECTVGTERAADDEDTRQIIQHLQAALDVSARQSERRASIRRRFNGSCSLPDLAIQTDFVGRMKGALDQFRSGAAHFGVSQK